VQPLYRNAAQPILPPDLREKPHRPVKSDVRPRKRRFNCDSQEPVENLGAWEEWGADNLGRGGQ
jgi:hypothetical protein